MIERVGEVHSITNAADAPTRGRALEDGRLDVDGVVLDRLANDIRWRFGLNDFISQADVVASLTYVVATTAPRQRWIRAFSSPLGRALVAAKRDLNTALAAVLSLLPAVRH
jgi:hypothetical protein